MRIKCLSKKIISNSIPLFPEQKGKLTYKFECSPARMVPIDSFLEELNGVVKDKKIVSFGEQHDFNNEKRLEDVKDFKDILLTTLYFLKQIKDQEKTKSEFNPFHIDLTLYWITKFGEAMSKFDLSTHKVKKDQLFSLPISEIIKYPASVIFAISILPLLKEEGFTDLVLEGFLEKSPDEAFKRSKDQVGMILIIESCLRLDINIHGAYQEGFGEILRATGIARAFEGKVDEILQNNPDAKVATYGGGVHNMTKPIEGSISAPFFGEVNLAELSFAPHLMERYQDAYLSIDLVAPTNGNEDLMSHFKVLRSKMVPGSIVQVNHSSKNQLGYIFPKN